MKIAIFVLSRLIVQMIQITQLFLFPVKSLAGIPVNTAELTTKGLKYDRRWLLMDENGEKLTQRTHPQLVLFQPKVLKEGIEVTFKDDKVLIPFNKEVGSRIEADVWGDKFEVVEVSTAVSSWFTNKLGIKVRLVHQPDDSHRSIDPRFSHSADDEVSAADGYPVLIISEESLSDLNRRLEIEIEMLRFRPNIVLKGLKPFGEDKLNLVEFINASLLGVKNCSRCIMVTNDLKAGKLGIEPLNTLSRFRKDGAKVLFGRNFIPQKLGQLSVGDQLL